MVIFVYWSTECLYREVFMRTFSTPRGFYTWSKLILNLESTTKMIKFTISLNSVYSFKAVAFLLHLISPEDVQLFVVS